MTAVVHYTGMIPGGREVIQYDVDDVDGDHDEALYAAYVEDNDAERSFQRDMSYARVALSRERRMPTCRVPRRGTSRARRTRARCVTRTTAAPSSGDPPSPDAATAAPQGSPR